MQIQTDATERLREMLGWWLVIAIVTVLTLVATAHAQEAAPAVMTGEEIDAIMTPFRLFGAVGGIAGSLTVIVQIFKKLLPALWAKLPMWARVAIPFVLGAAGAIWLGVLNGVALPLAITTGLIAGGLAIGGNQGGKALLKVVKKTEVEDPTPG